jgi:3-phenylpropionate/cinnamic acid dioxygenase small subunit
MDRLDAAVQEIVDRQRITDVINGYAAGIDFKNWGDWEDLFAEEAVIDYPGGHYEGRIGLAAWLQNRMRGFPLTQHIISNVDIRIDGDSARSVAYLHAVHVPDPQKPDRHFDTGGWYINEYIREGPTWRIRRLALTRIWSMGDPLTPRHDVSPT